MSFTCFWIHFFTSSTNCRKKYNFLLLVPRKFTHIFPLFSPSKYVYVTWNGRNSQWNESKVSEQNNFYFISPRASFHDKQQQQSAAATVTTHWVETCHGGWQKLWAIKILAQKKRCQQKEKRTKKNKNFTTRRPPSTFKRVVMAGEKEKLILVDDKNLFIH